MESSPKTINIDDSKEQVEFNYRITNIRRSPRNTVYQKIIKILNKGIFLME